MTNPSLPLNPPSTLSAEYRRNYGLAQVRADAGYAVGATGKGITVAVVDTGFNFAAADMQGAYSADSADIIAGRNAIGGVDGHGAKVAEVLASRFNGFGTIGMAYESTVLAIRADNTAASACVASCVFTQGDLANAVDYAVAKGAKIVNLSLGNVVTDGDQTALLEAALTRAVSAGVVFTIASGNAAASDPTLLAPYAVDSRYAGSLLAIGATDATGALASFSNRAGASREGYLVAPGVDVITECTVGDACESTSGTSFATPHVAGAVAMLLQYFPNISGRDAISIILRTAEDKGEAGADAVYGRGALNLARAFEPVGASSLALADGAQIDLPATTPDSLLGAAFGDAIQDSGALTTVIRDDYQRLFAIDLATAYRGGQRSSATVAMAPPVLETAEVIATPLGAALTLAAQVPMFPYAEADSSPVRSLLRPEAPSSAAASVRLGAFAFTAWRGQGPASAPQGLGGRNAFQTLAAADRSVSAVWRAGAWALSGEGGWAERRTAMSLTPVDSASYATATAAYAAPGFRLSLAAGALDEPRGALGSEFDPASPLSIAARTRFAAVALNRPVGPLWLRAEASVGRTLGGGQLVGIDGAVSSSWRLALSGACDPALPCARFGLELAQPLRVERGSFRALLADAPAAYDDPLTFSERRFSAAPSGRELDLRLNVERPLGEGAVRLEAAAAFNPAHRSGEADLGLSAAWRTRF